MFRTARVAAGVAAILAALPLTTAQAQDKLIISTANPPQHMATRTMQMFADALVDRSGGALEVEIFDSSQLYNARDVGKAVARGDVGFANVPTPYLGRTVGSINVLDLPMLKGMTQMERSEMLDGPLGEQLGSMLEEKMGVEVPGNWPLMGPIMYWSTKKPLTSFEEFKGMNMRIPGGAAPAALVEAMGSIAVKMPGSDMPLALQQGTVDATMASIESVVVQNLRDVGISYGFWDRGIVGYMIPLVSADYWGSLNADQQALFTEVWNETVDWQRQEAMALEGEYRATLEAQGIVITDASVEDAAEMGLQMMSIQAPLVEKTGITAEVLALAQAAVE